MSEGQKHYTIRQHDAVFGLGFIGTAVYFIQHASDFWIGLLGLLKALVWPAVLLYTLLEFLKL